MAARRTPRRRRTQQEAEAEILDGAERFLEEHSWHDLTVEEVMARTTMTRNAFYHYFPDRKALFVRLIARAGAELAAMTDAWLSGHGTLYDDALATLEGVSEAYARHGRLLRAAAEAAAQDADVARLRDGLVAGFVALTEQWVDRQIAAGAMRPPSDGTTTRELATALIALDDAYLGARYGWSADPPTGVAARTLLQIWVGALLQLTPEQLERRGRRHRRAAPRRPAGGG